MILSNAKPTTIEGVLAAYPTLGMHGRHYYGASAQRHRDKLKLEGAAESIESARKWIRENCAKKLSRVAFANILYLTPRSLARYVEETTGVITPFGVMFAAFVLEGYQMDDGGGTDSEAFVYVKFTKASDHGCDGIIYRIATASSSKTPQASLPYWAREDETSPPFYRLITSFFRSKSDP